MATGLALGFGAAAAFFAVGPLDGTGADLGLVAFLLDEDGDVPAPARLEGGLVFSLIASCPGSSDASATFPEGPKEIAENERGKCV